MTAIGTTQIQRSRTTEKNRREESPVWHLSHWGRDLIFTVQGGELCCFHQNQPVRVSGIFHDRSAQKSPKWDDKKIATLFKACFIIPRYCAKDPKRISSVEIHPRGLGGMQIVINYLNRSNTFSKLNLHVQEHTSIEELKRLVRQRLSKTSEEMVFSFNGTTLKDKNLAENGIISGSTLDVVFTKLTDTQQENKTYFLKKGECTYQLNLKNSKTSKELIRLHVQENTTVEELERLVRERLGKTSEEMVLSFNGITLKDKNLAENGIISGSTLDVDFIKSIDAKQEDKTYFLKKDECNYQLNLKNSKTSKELIHNLVEVYSPFKANYIEWDNRKLGDEENIEQITSTEENPFILKTHEPDLEKKKPTEGTNQQHPTGKKNWHIRAIICVCVIVAIVRCLAKWWYRNARSS